MHSNLSFLNYKNSPPPSLSVKADFTADNDKNATYMLGAIWFFRALSKTDFGEKAKNPGLPPPILYLNGWGGLINNIPVVITGFNVDLPKDKHYVQIGSSHQWVPTQLSMNISLKIQPNIEKYKKQFDLEAYKSGVLGHVLNSEVEGYELSNFDNVFVSNVTNFKIEDRVTVSQYYNNETKQNEYESTNQYTSITPETAYTKSNLGGGGWTW